MDEQLLTILKLCLLALLYLFFFRVLRAVWAEVRGPQVVAAGAPRQAARQAGREAKRGGGGRVAARPRIKSGTVRMALENTSPPRPPSRGLYRSRITSGM